MRCFRYIGANAGTLYQSSLIFFFAKSVTQQHKVEMVQGKAKALRKEIKRSSEGQAAHIEIQIES